MREMPLLCACRKERSDGIAIATKSIASSCPPAERFRGFPQTKCGGGTEYGRDALNDTFGECVVAKANEADCGAQTPKSKHLRKGGIIAFNIIILEIPACPERGGYCIKGIITKTYSTIKTFLNI